MGDIVNLEPVRPRRDIVPIIFVEMFEDQLWGAFRDGMEHAENMLRNCRRLLERARAERWPVAFSTAAQRVMRPGPRWIDGFRPTRSDMVFEIPADSCYSDPQFERYLTEAGRCFLMAGFSGERLCLATLMHAAEFGHHGALITDASATWPLHGYSMLDSHKAVVALASRYATLLSTNEWLTFAGTGKSDLEPCYDPG